MNRMVLGIASRHWEGYRKCVDSWQSTAVNSHPEYEVVNKPILEAFQEIYENTTEPIIALMHDDLMVYEQDWDYRVLSQFEDERVGMVGFGGALGHGAPDLYTTPYCLPKLARQNFLSNMRSWRLHGERITGQRDVAVFDGFAIFVRRSIIEKWGGFPVGKPYGYWMYCEALCCEARRQGYKLRLVGIDCEHLGGKTVGMVPLTDDYQEAHRYFFEQNRDMMPYRVPE